MSIMPTMAGMLRLIAKPKSNPRKGGKRSVSIDVIRDDERAIVPSRSQPLSLLNPHRRWRRFYKLWQG